MARQARLVIPGEIHHLLQRGHNRQPIVLDEADAQFFLASLREATRLHEVNVHAYALMPTHLHVLATPSRADGLARAMQTLGRRYVAHFNRRHGCSGTLWEGRFRTCIVGTPNYLPILVYVEQSAVRGGLVERPQEARWSSAPHHLGLLRDPLIAEHADYWALGNTPFDREHRLRAALEQPQDPVLLSTIRRHVQAGWPWAAPATLQRWEQEHGRSLTPRPVGRPRINYVPN